MANKIETAIDELRGLWSNLDRNSIFKIRSTLQGLAKDHEVNKKLLAENLNSPNGLELYRDPKDGWVLLEYIEKHGKYRIPHDHGRAWVIYVVMSGDVEMGSYFNATRPDGLSHLVLKGRERLTSGDAHIYYPGEIHDTLCVSENAHILRLTSLDLKEEERAGHVKRYQIEKE